MNPRSRPRREEQSAAARPRIGRRRSAAPSSALAAPPQPGQWWTSTDGRAHLVRSIASVADTGARGEAACQARTTVDLRQLAPPTATTCEACRAIAALDPRGPAVSVLERFIANVNAGRPPMTGLSADALRDARQRLLEPVRPCGHPE